MKAKLSTFEAMACRGLEPQSNHAATNMTQNDSNLKPCYLPKYPGEGGWRIKQDKAWRLQGCYVRFFTALDAILCTIVCFCFHLHHSKTRKNQKPNLLLHFLEDFLEERTQTAG